jgi:hypothetical protein
MAGLNAPIIAVLVLTVLAYGNLGQARMLKPGQWTAAGWQRFAWLAIYRTGRAFVLIDRLI